MSEFFKEPRVESTTMIGNRGDGSMFIGPTMNIGLMERTHALGGLKIIPQTEVMFQVTMPTDKNSTSADSHQYIASEFTFHTREARLLAAKIIEFCDFAERVVK